MNLSPVVIEEGDSFRGASWDEDNDRMIWSCNHMHEDLDEADECANEYLAVYTSQPYQAASLVLGFSQKDK